MESEKEKLNVRLFPNLQCLISKASIISAIAPDHLEIKLEKSFSEKPIVAFTNSTVFILDSIYVTKPVLSHVFVLSLEPLDLYSHLRGILSPDYKYLHAIKYLTN